MEKKEENKYAIPLAIVIAGLLISVAIYISPSSIKNKDSVVQPQKEIKASVKDVQIENEPFIGDKNAPVTLIYWTDYQCSFCKRFDLQTLPEIVKNYVDTGKLKIVFKDLQFLGPASEIAGHAAKAVWELYPDSYFEWNQIMFDAQGSVGDKESIINLTKKISAIDSKKVSDLMEKNKVSYQKEQDEDKIEASELGINGTPGFVLGDQIISGAQPFNVFAKIIDIELSK